MSGAPGAHRPARILRILVILLAAFYSYELFASVCVMLVRAAMPYADNGWADHAQIYSLHRMAAGGPAYTAPIERDSYLYGPLYLWLLNALRAFLRLPVSAPTFHGISMTLGILTVIPLSIVTATLAPLAGVTRRARPAFFVALAATVAIGTCAITHNLTYSTLHPDNALFPLAATSLALYFLIGRRLVSPWWLAGFIPLCTLAFLTKANAVALAPLLIAALLAAKRVSLVAAVASGGFALAGAVFAYAALSQDAKLWTITIPASQPIFWWRWYQLFVNLFLGSRDGVSVFFTGATIFAAAVCAYIMSRREGNVWAMLICGAVVAATAVAVPAYLKEGGTWNNLVFISVCCVPFAGILAALPFRAAAQGSLSGELSATAGAVLVWMSVSFALSNQQAPVARDIEQLEGARTYAASLCRSHPNDQIYVSQFVDLFFDCPNAFYRSHYAVEALAWAEPKFSIGAPLDPDPHTRYAAFVRSLNFDDPRWLEPNYRVIESMQIIVGEWWPQYDHVRLVFYERKPGR